MKQPPQIGLAPHAVPSPREEVGEHPLQPQALASLSTTIDVLAEKVAEMRIAQTARRRAEIELLEMRQRMEREHHLRVHLENMLSVKLALTVKRQFDRMPVVKQVMRRVLGRFI